MLASGVARLKPRLADRIGYVEIMEDVRRPGLLGDVEHPAPPVDPVGREIEHDRKPGAQKVGDMRRPSRSEADSEYVIMSGIDLISSG